MPRLREIAREVGRQRSAASPGDPEPEACDLCGEPVPAEHRHLIDLQSRELMCCCRACSLLFDRERGTPGGGHFRLVPDRRLFLADFELDDAAWAALRIPVDMAFFFHHSGEGRVVAFYPSPMGPTESLLELDTWEEIERANLVLRTMEPDVEALLVNRARGPGEHYVVPIEDPYRLVALIRTRWRGFTGGSEVWEEIEAFFAGLRSRATVVHREREEAAWGS
jgi:hypothetical protein